MRKGEGVHQSSRINGILAVALRASRSPRFANREEQLSMRAYSQKRRLLERYENVQNIQREQTGSDVLRAPSTGDDILRCDSRPPAKALLHIIDSGQIDESEIAGPLASHRQRGGENEEAIPPLKDIIGLPNGCNAAAILEPLLKLSYVHVAPDASVYRASIFDLAAAEHHSRDLWRSSLMATLTVRAVPQAIPSARTSLVAALRAPRAVCGRLAAARLALGDNPLR